MPSQDAGLVAGLLEQCVPNVLTRQQLEVEQLSTPRRGKRPPYDLVVHQRRATDDTEYRSGLLFPTTGSAHSVTAALRRLVRDEQPPHCVFLVTDERTSLPLGPIGKDYYAELRQRGDQHFRHLELSFAQYAELDALQATVGLARSGDLEIELPGGQTRPVSVEEVIASHQQQGRYAAAPVLKDFLTELPTGSRSQGPGSNSAASVGCRHPADALEE